MHDMKPVLLCLLILVAATANAQRDFGAENTRAIYDKIFEAKYVEKPPVFPFGVDSCKRYYFAHFAGFDSVLTKAIMNGDTAKYIRVYFSFVIGKSGTAGDGHFEKIASADNARAKDKEVKTIKYFAEDKKYYDDLVKQMVAKMTFWKPASQDNVLVDCKVDDYIQFWVGINPPTK
jgi:hypothetical protein